MATEMQLLVIWILITKHFAGAENFFENIADTTTQQASTPPIDEAITETTELEAIEQLTTTTQSSLTREFVEEKSDKFPDLEKKIIYGSEEAQSPARNLANGELIRIILKDLLSSQNENKDAANNSTKYFLKLTPKPLESLATIQNVNLTNEEGELPRSTMNTSDEPLTRLETTDKLNLAESELVRVVLKEVTTLSSKREELEKSSTESLIEVRPSPHKLFNTVGQNAINTGKEQKVLAASLNGSLISEAKKSSNSLESFQKSNSARSELPQKISTPEKVEDLQESSTESSTTSAEPWLNKKKSLISFEEYAVKQMNFILDYLLIETQEFVAKVLQATVNSVFPRDQLKRYAEDLNGILNPDSDSDYSSEIIEDMPGPTEDEIYEEIVKKLNFLKSKPSKFLQRNLPQEWINDYRNKKAELTIWLDKATEQMHKEFNCYVTEEEDRIKYQYFNETFDDISRATEIHHKLALLADLVKIVKNKKQITFMDLYMQT